MQRIQVRVCCVVMGTPAYPWTLLQQSLNNHTQTEKNSLFITRVEFVLTLCLCRSLFAQTQQYGVKCQKSCSFQVRSERMCFCRGVSCSSLGQWRKLRTPGQFQDLVLPLDCSSIHDSGQKIAEWLSTSWLPATLLLLGEVEAADWK